MKGTAISGDTHPPASIKTLKGWLDICLTSHQTCKPGLDPALPSRVIQIIHLDGSLRVQLVETRGRCGRYVCLSHRSDDPLSRSIIRSTLRSEVEIIPWSSLTTTVQDAITVVSGLGLEYLWIDSLCIVQDDLDGLDDLDDLDDLDYPVQDVSQMAGIYQNAFLTLAATASIFDDGGLFRKVPPKTVKVVGAELRTPVFLRKVLPHPADWDSDSIESQRGIFPLLARASVYQQRLLSPRFVHFTTNELVWECAEKCTCECNSPSAAIADVENPKASLFRLLRNHPSIEDLSKRWHQIIAEYTALDLSSMVDKLPGISDIARRLGQHLVLGEYYAGLWKNTIYRDFLWVASRKSKNAEKESNLPSLNKVFDVPSWSWASTSRRVTMTGKACIDIDFGEISCSTAGTDPYGRVLRGSIELSGYLLPAILTREFGTSMKGPFYKCAVADEWTKCPLVEDYDLLHIFMNSLSDPSRVFCLKTGAEDRDGTAGSALCIILRRTEDDPTVYKRIGILSASTELVNDVWFKDVSEKTTLKLV